MPTPAQVRTAVNARLATLWPLLVARQETYFTANNRYFQGLLTHNTPPSEGDDTAITNSTIHPHYQSETWADLLGVNLPATLNFALEVTQYQTPAGVYGWVATVHVGIAGQVWSRSQGVGPEDRNVAWTRME